MDRKVQKLRNKEIKYVKVLWKNHGYEEATWESEEEIKRRYPHLFNKPGKSLRFEDKTFFKGGRM